MILDSLRKGRGYMPTAKKARKGERKGPMESASEITLWIKTLSQMF